MTEHIPTVSFQLKTQMYLKVESAKPGPWFNPRDEPTGSGRIIVVLGWQPPVSLQLRPRLRRPASVSPVLPETDGHRRDKKVGGLCSLRNGGGFCQDNRALGQNSF